MFLIIYITIGLVISILMYSVVPSKDDTVGGRIWIMFLWPMEIVLVAISLASIYALVKSNKHKTKEGKTLKLSEMTEEHLKNCISFGKRNMPNIYWKFQIPKFEKELKRRELGDTNGK